MSVHPATEAEIQSLAGDALGAPPSSVLVSEHDGGGYKQIHVSVAITTGVTYAKLKALSVALGTDEIDITPAVDGGPDPSYDYAPGTPAHIKVTIGVLPPWIPTS
jgi:hypothetical protein